MQVFILLWILIFVSLIRLGWGVLASIFLAMVRRWVLDSPSANCLHYWENLPYSYTGWVDTVQVKGTDNEEVYLTRFENIWLELKKRRLDYLAQKPLLSDFAASMLCAIAIGRKSTPPSEQGHYIGTASHGARAGFG
jgi:hypothetical protein